MEAVEARLEERSVPPAEVQVIGGAATQCRYRPRQGVERSAEPGGTDADGKRLEQEDGSGGYPQEHADRCVLEHVPLRECRCYLECFQTAVHDCLYEAVVCRADLYLTRGGAGF